MFKIISTKRYNELLNAAIKCSTPIEDKPVLNCGYKSCQFTTTDPKGLKIHRARIHKKK